MEEYIAFDSHKRYTWVEHVHASGDRTRYGRTRPDVNRYLKWAFAEAANSVAVNYRRWPERYVSSTRGCAHGKATPRRWARWRAIWRNPRFTC